MSEDIGAEAGALDAGVSIDGRDPGESGAERYIARQKQEPEFRAAYAAAEDAMLRLRGKVEMQEQHLANAREALAAAEAALSELEA